MRFKDLKTRTKLFSGYTIIIALSILIALAAIRALYLYNHTVKCITLIDEIVAKGERSRLLVREFITSGDNKDGEEARATLKEMNHLIHELDSVYTDNTSKDEISKLAENNKLYLQLTDSTINTIIHLNELANNSERLGDELATTLLAKNDAVNSLVDFYFIKARVSYLSYRFLNKEESARASEEYAQKAINESQKDEAIHSIVVNYMKMLEDAISDIRQQKSLEKKLKEIGPKVVESCNILDNTLKENAEIVFKASISTIIIFLIISFLLALAVSYYITHYLTVNLSKGIELTQTYASGDLTAKIPEEELTKKDELGDLARAMDAMSTKIKEVVATIIQSTRHITTAGEQISETTQLLSQGANEQASSVEEISASVEEMTANIQVNTDNAKQTEVIAASASKGMQDVAESARKSLVAVKAITSKISIINDIAFQTNILALNAAVEAARAGEHGRGFAVVAAEVRKLAERSKLAANEIVILSDESLQFTEESANKIKQILPEIEHTAVLVQEIMAANIEQNNGASQINNAIQGLNEVTQQNAAAAEELAANIEELANQSEALLQMVEYFKVN